MDLLILIAIVIGFKTLIQNTTPPAPAPKPQKTATQIANELFAEEILQIMAQSPTLLTLGDLRAYYPSTSIQKLSAICNYLTVDNKLKCIYINRLAYYGIPNKNYEIKLK